MKKLFLVFNLTINQVQPQDLGTKLPFPMDYLDLKQNSHFSCAYFVLIGCTYICRLFSLFNCCVYFETNRRTPIGTSVMQFLSFCACMELFNRLVEVDSQFEYYFFSFGFNVKGETQNWKTTFYLRTIYDLSK